jgi:hypothetical protein
LRQEALVSAVVSESDAYLGVACQFVDSAVMIIVVVGAYEVVDSCDASCLHDGLDPRSIAVSATINEKGLATGRNEQRRVTLLDIDMVDIDSLRARRATEN